jgi:hypothetical protein
MCTTFSAFDIELPRTSLEQSQYGVRISNEEAKRRFNFLQDKSVETVLTMLVWL